MKRLLLIAFGLVMLLSDTKLFAQQDPHYSMYIFNGMAINPAYAGSREVVSAMALYRHQWGGIEGNPKTLAASVHSPFGADKRIGLGFSLMNDNISVFNLTSFNLNYAYRLPVGKGKNAGRLAMGVLATVNWVQSSANELQGNDAVDQTINQIPENTINPNFGLGLYYHTNRYYVGFSVPHLLNTSLTQNFDLEGTRPRARQFKHYFVTAGYIFDIKGGDFKIKPSFLLKAVQNSEVSVDINLATLFYDILWVGASYRYDDAVVLFAEITLSQRLRVGYAYDFTLSELQDYSNGTHEVMLGYEFIKEEVKIKTPRFF